MQRFALTALTAVILGASLTGCAAERTCAHGEYPVVNAEGMGGDCVPEGEQPPTGYLAYPAHKVPAHFEDTYVPTLQDYLNFGNRMQQRQAEREFESRHGGEPATTGYDHLRSR